MNKKHLILKIVIGITSWWGVTAIYISSIAVNSDNLINPTPLTESLYTIIGFIYLIITGIYMYFLHKLIFFNEEEEP